MASPGYERACAVSKRSTNKATSIYESNIYDSAYIARTRRRAFICMASKRGTGGSNVAVTGMTKQS